MIKNIHTIALFGLLRSRGSRSKLLFLSKGFSAIELMVVIAILGALAAVALPSFITTMQTMRVRTAISAIVSTLYLAKSEAIKQAGGVTIQPVGAAWNTGWTVRNAGGTVLRSVPAFSDVTISHLSGAGTITVDRWGKFSGGGLLAANFSATTSLGASVSQAVCVGAGGRITQKSGSTCP